MATIQDNHRELAHQVYMMGELHGRKELERAIAQAIADAEERGGESAKRNREIVDAILNSNMPLDGGDDA